MLEIALVVLAVAALGGAAMSQWPGRPGWARMGHGLIGTAGLVLLLIGAWGSGRPLLWIAFVLILLGFSGGAFIFGPKFKQQRPPGLMIAGHGLLNLLGVALLAWVVLVE